MTRRRFSARAYEARLAEFNGCCAECGIETGGAAGLEWDHVIPIEMGGEDAINNLQPLCRGCHRAKTRADVGHIAKAKRMRQRDSGIRRTGGMPTRQPHLKQMPPTKAYPRGRVVDRRTGEIVWPRPSAS